MISQLVGALSAGNHRIEAGGADAVHAIRGHSYRRLTVYQTRYLIDGLHRGHYRQITRSFRAARRAAAASGAELEGWVLCLPVDLVGPAVRWWADWARAREADTGIAIGLWSASELRRRLHRRESARVRRRFYGGAPEGPSPPAATPLLAAGGSATGSGQRSASSDRPVGPSGAWADGERCRIADRSVLLRDIEHRPGADGHWFVRTATGIPTDGVGPALHLRQVVALPATDGGLRRQGALRTQERYLAGAEHVAGLPRPLALDDRAGAVTLVLQRPDGPSWAAAFPPLAPGTPRALRIRQVAAAVAPLAEALLGLHGAGLGHGEIGQRTVAIGPDGGGMLLDLGAAGGPALPARPGTLRAPEQVGREVEPDADTDLWLLAGLVHLGLTGFPPSPPHTPAIAASVPGFPGSVDRLILACLDARPAHRPADGMAELVRQLTSVRWTLPGPGPGEP